MTIDPEKFKADLSKEYTKLLNSKRGLASELARTIGKDPSFINSIKKNKPVNGLHLKAVELIFGPQKVLELLSLNEYIPPKEVDNGQDIPNTKSMIKNFFRLPQKGQDAINALLKIEHIDEQTFRRTVADLEFIADKLNEGASPGPLVAVSENKTLGELSKEKGNI